MEICWARVPSTRARSYLVMYRAVMRLTLGLGDGVITGAGEAKQKNEKPEEEQSSPGARRHEAPQEASTRPRADTPTTSATGKREGETRRGAPHPAVRTKQDGPHPPQPNTQPARRGGHSRGQQQQSQPRASDACPTAAPPHEKPNEPPTGRGASSTRGKWPTATRSYPPPPRSNPPKPPTPIRPHHPPHPPTHTSASPPRAPK